ncbi:MAG TPA: PAS domain-containing protein [Dongiaceae bacterium]
MAKTRAAYGSSEIITTLAFLDVCDEHVRELFAYWDLRRNGRVMPLRRNIDPADFPRHLPGILLVDVQWEPLDFVYRVVGTREAEARGFNPTGKPVAGNWFGSSEERVLSNYRYVATKASFLYDYDPFITDDSHFQVDESLFLPLSLTGDRVDQVLVYSHYEDLWRKVLI